MKNTSSIFLKCFFFISLLLISIIGCWNYCSVNKNTEIICNDACRKISQSDTLDESKKTNDNLEKQSQSGTNLINSLTVTSQSFKNELNLSLLDLEKQKQYIFDGNTITFFVTLIIVLLAGYLVMVQDKLRERMDKHDEEWNINKENLRTQEENLRIQGQKLHDEWEKDIKNDRIILDEYKQKVNASIQESYIYNILYSIYLASIDIESLLVTHEYKIIQPIFTLIYHIDRRIDGLQETIPNSINLQAKRQFVELLSNSMQSLHISDIKKTESNLKIIKPIEDTYYKLLDLKDKISSLEKIFS